MKFTKFYETNTFWKSKRCYNRILRWQNLTKTIAWLVICISIQAAWSSPTIFQNSSLKHGLIPISDKLSISEHPPNDISWNENCIFMGSIFAIREASFTLDDGEDVSVPKMNNINNKHWALWKTSLIMGFRLWTNIWHSLAIWSCQVDSYNFLNKFKTIWIMVNIFIIII